MNHQKKPVRQHAFLKPSEVKRLEQYISRIDFSEEGIDGMSSEEWLIEYKNQTDYYIFLRGENYNTLKHKETIEYFLGLRNMLKYLGMKYFHSKS